MALQVASLYGVLRMDDGQFRQSLQDARSGMGDLGGQLQRVGGQLTAFGGQLTLMTAPLGAALGVAVRDFTSFDEAVTNTGAVLGLTRDEITKLTDHLQFMGERTRFGPQAVAEAMYDIAGGVADASSHMAILTSSIMTATAGNARLAGTTKALISVMNSYKFGAERAAYASNVLTRTVGMGVGSMDEFAAALPQVTGLANSLGIAFEDLGAMTAYLTTQGNTASQATTQLAAMMTALLNPNETMKKGLRELGFSSGQAAIEALGLAGAFTALAGTQTARDGMAKMSGSVEALRGITALAGPDVAEFFATFKSGVEGATDAAYSIQMGSAAAQFDLLKSSVQGLGIEAGQVLTPILINIANDMRPVVFGIMEWMQKNPELTEQIIMVAGALVIAGPLIAGAGIVLSGLGTIAGAVTGALTFLLSPVGLLIVGIGGLVFALSQLYPGGLAKLLTDAATAARQLAIIGLGILGAAANWARDRVRELLQTILDVIAKINELKAGLAAWGGIGQNVSTVAGMVASGQVSPGQVIEGLIRAIGAEIRDVGGAGMAGQPYLIGTGAQPELFIPSTSGTFVPNADRMGGTQMHFSAGSVVIQANSRAEGAAAAEGWWQRMEELRRAQG